VSRITATLALLVVAGALVGTAGGATRLQRHAVSGQGLSLAVPGSWVVADSRLPAALLERLSRENPRFAPFIQGLAASNAPMKFIALDPDVRDGFATNVNVVVTAVPASTTFAAYRLGVAAGVRSVLAGQRISESVVTIHGSRAVRLRYRLRLRVGRTFTVQTLQYAFLRRARSVVVTYTTLPHLAVQYQRTFASSAATIRFSRT